MVKLLGVLLIGGLITGCSTTGTMEVPLISGDKVYNQTVSTVSDPSLKNDRFAKGYQKALDDVKGELRNTGPYSLTMNPEPVYRGPVYLRTYLNSMRIGRVYYPEGWYMIEATPGSPGGARYRPNR